MKIGLRILLGYFLIVSLAAWFVLNVFVEEVKPGVRETLEDTLVVDTAQLLADPVSENWRRGFGFATALTLLYGALYGLLQSENNALVLGSTLVYWQPS